VDPQHLPHRLDAHPRLTPLARLAWLLLGLLALAIACIGLVLPIFPGLPFGILAGLCFATASRRLQIHLERIPALRRPLHSWHRARHAGVREQLRTAGALMALALVEALRWLTRPFASRRAEGMARR
jgi:uncharacterized membrane protein YbaN (DUF454 family)